MINGPKTINDNLILYYDAKNLKSNNRKLSQADIEATEHGLSEWYCFEGATFKYTAIYSDTIIYEVTSANVVTELVSKTSGPTSGDVTLTTGNRYYGTKPIHLTCLGHQHRIAPSSLSGTYHGHYSSRDEATDFDIYCPEGSGTVYFYDNVVGGVTGTETSSTAISAGNTISLSAPLDATYSIFYSTVPVIIVANEENLGSPTDKMIVPPASTNIYRRRDHFERTINNTAPATISAYHVSDTLRCFAVDIGDGGGTDASQGIGIENLSNTYGWGTTLSDYTVVSPYNSTIKVFYYSNDDWVLGETHTMTGTTTSPTIFSRDGDNGFGVAATLLSGGAANMASGATLWKWESDQPFALFINDSSQDEDILLGWNRNKQRRGVIRDLSKNKHHGRIHKNVKDVSNDMHFGGDSDYIHVGSNAAYNSPTNITLEVWCYPERSSSYEYLFSNARDSGGSYDGIGLRINNGTPSFRIWNSTAQTVNSSVDVTLNNWYHIVGTYDTVNGSRIYVNGVLRGTNASLGGIGTPATYDMYVGRMGFNEQYEFQGNINIAKIYSDALTADEVLQNFNATKNRFGL